MLIADPETTLWADRVVFYIRDGRLLTDERERVCETAAAQSAAGAHAAAGAHGAGYAAQALQGIRASG